MGKGGMEAEGDRGERIGWETGWEGGTMGGGWMGRNWFGGDGWEGAGREGVSGYEG